MSLRICQPGLQSLLVDHGRPHCRHLGLPLGGAADRSALALGNALVGNEPDAAAIEMTLLGPTVEALQPTACVVFGAPFQASVRGQLLAPGTTFTLEAGDVLHVGGTNRGVRGYLCVAGGFDAPDVLGSRSSLQPLLANDVLICRASRIDPRGLPEQAYQWASDNERVLRVLEGPQQDWFADTAFFNQSYEVLPASNRMGVRLKGPPLLRRPGELISEAVAPGAIQVTNDGLPVILGVDGQTIGGYPKIAHVIRADLDQLAQLRPGERVQFVVVSLDQAEQAARQRNDFLAGWLARLRVAERPPVFI
jgi:biotin-dependent carboxylase-like uncharacterized protein